MLATLLTGTFERPSVTVAEVDRPTCGSSRALVRVASAGITRMEPHWITGWRKADGSPQSRPLVLGCEFSGDVVAVGEGVDDLSVGRRVFGATGQYDKGAMAEFVAVEAEHALPLADGIPHEVASTLPLAGLTAWQALIRHGRLQCDQRVLIHGGAGGVGTFATQIARWVGAHVVVTARAGDAALCARLGADEVVDFERSRFEERGGGYDLVFDQVGGEVQERSWAVLRPGGRLVTIAGEETDAPDQDRARALGVSATFFIVDRDVIELRRLEDLVASGVIVPIVGKRLDFRSVAEAFEGTSGRFVGKAVMTCSRT